MKTSYCKGDCEDTDVWLTLARATVDIACMSQGNLTPKIVQIKTF